jgi:type I restriction-modification system DNA methylase subunit
MILQAPTAPKAITDEHVQKGHAGRFGPGLPRVSDGSLLFLLHLVAKMRPPAKGKDGTMQGGSRIGIILNGSPLFTGGAGSGESEIRRHLLENDLVEAIIALPTDMFYNTGIATYIWILSNHNPAHRDFENVPLGEDIHAYFAREVTPHLPHAWIDESKRDDQDGEIGIVGYEIPFNRHFYTYTPPRPLDAIDAELAEVTGEIQEMLQEVAGI